MAETTQNRMAAIGRQADHIGLIHSLCEGPGDPTQWTPCRYPACDCDPAHTAAITGAQALLDHGDVVVHGTTVTRLREALEAARELFVALAADHHLDTEAWALDWQALEDHAR